MRLRGESYRVRGRTLRHFAELEAQLIHLRGDPFVDIRRLPEFIYDADTLHATVQELFVQADQQWAEVDDADCLRWANDTWSGRCFSAWQAIRDNDPGRFTLEYVSQAVLSAVDAGRSEEVEHLRQAIQQANGDDELGALDRIDNLLTGAQTSEPATWRRIVRSLVDEPFCLRMHEIAELTVGQCVLLATDPETMKGEMTFRNEFQPDWKPLDNLARQAAGNLIEGKPWIAKSH